MMMMNKFGIFIGVLFISTLVRAMIVTKYERTPVTVTSDVLSCGELAGSIDFCAARVTSDTCEPLTRDWCETKDMSISGSYLIKRTIEHVPENTYMTSYKRRVPTYFPVGSVIEMEFMARANWTGFRCNLMDVNESAVLHVVVESEKIYTCWKKPGNVSCFNKTILQPQTYYTDTKYVLGIMLDVRSFHIYMDGEHVWTYNPILQVSSVADVRTFFRNVNGNLFRVTFKI